MLQGGKMKKQEFCPKCNTLRKMEYITEISDEPNYSSQNVRNGVSINIKICTSCGNRFIDFKERKNRRRQWHYDLDWAVLYLVYIFLLLSAVYINEYIGGFLLLAVLLLSVLFSGTAAILKLLKSEAVSANTEFDSAYEPVIPKPNRLIELSSVTKQAVKKIKPEKVYKLITAEEEYYVLVTDIKCREQVELYFKLNAEETDGEVEIYDGKNRYLGSGRLKAVL